MKTLNETFLAALSHSIKEHKSQRQVALRAGITPQYLNDILKSKSYGSEETRRQIAKALGFPGRQYEDFLEMGRAILEDKPIPQPRPDYLTSDDMEDRGFFTVPFSDNMKLAAGEGGRIPVTEEAGESVIVVHGPSIGRHSAKKLQAFRVGGPSMEPLIADGGIVLADLSHNDIRKIKDGRIYVVCWDLDDGECAVKYLRWFDKKEGIVSIESEDRFFKPKLKRINEVVLIGKVFWAWREFPD